MDHFQYRDGQLYCEDVPVDELANLYGTPLYVYSQATLLHHLRALQNAFAPARPIICYSVKANGNLNLCRLLGAHGAGFDVTSGGELYRALRAGPSGAPIVFAGVGKTEAEIRMALEAGVLLFDVESEEELWTIDRIAQQQGRRAPVALRVNPDLPPKTHVKTDTSVKGVKFGLDLETVLEVAEAALARRGLQLLGLHMHLGSPILRTEPYQQGAEKAVHLIEALRRQGHQIRYLNMGGGFGIHYRLNEAPPAEAFARVILPAVQATNCQLILEPGRFIVGNSGILVSTVLYRKSTGGKHYLIQDAAMNDLIRPTLYGSLHRVWPVHLPAGIPERPPIDMNVDPDQANPFLDFPGSLRQDVVGPVCESGDFLAKDRPLPLLEPGQRLAIFSAGAYGMSMASNYNSRPRAAEVLVTDATHRLIRRRETYDDLIACEQCCLP
jgi:diaminopimelate decarboxylase